MSGSDCAGGEEDEGGLGGRRTRWISHRGRRQVFILIVIVIMIMIVIMRMRMRMRIQGLMMKAIDGDKDEGLGLR